MTALPTYCTYYALGGQVSECDEFCSRQKMTLARRVAGALMRFGSSTSIKELLTQVENKTEEELLQLAEENGMPTPLPLVTGIKPGRQHEIDNSS